MSDFGESFAERLHKAIAGVPPERRADAEEALRVVHAAGGTSFEGLAAVFRDRAHDRGTRERAAWLLSLLQDARAVPVLMEALADREFDLRELAAWALGHLQKKRVAPALIRLFRNPAEDPAVRVAVAHAFAVLGSRRPLRSLVVAMHTDPHPLVREAAAYGLAFLGDQRVFDPLVRVLTIPGEVPAVRAQAAEGLAYLGDARAVPPLLAALEDPAPEVRFWAAFALGHVGDAGVLPALDRLAAEDDTEVAGWWSVRKEAEDAAEHIRRRIADQ